MWPMRSRVSLYLRVMVMLSFLSSAPVFLAVPPPHPLLLFRLNLPCRPAAVADALSCMLSPTCFFLFFLFFVLSLSWLQASTRHFPDPLFSGAPNAPGSLDPTISCPDFACPWCHSEVNLL
jgi:apolipoprotein N-acyltransferase